MKNKMNTIVNKKRIYIITILMILIMGMLNTVQAVSCTKCSSSNVSVLSYTSSGHTLHCNTFCANTWTANHSYSGNTCSVCGYTKSSSSSGTTGTITGHIVSWNHTNNGIVNMEVTATSTTGMRFVRFPTWSDVNGQDDIVWHEVVGAGPTYTISIDLKNHSPGTTGLYHIHVYGYRVGSSTGVMLGGVDVYYDTTAPTATGLSLSTSYTNTGTLRATAIGVADSGGSGVGAVQWYVRKADWSTGILDQASTGQWYYDVDVTSLGEGTYIVGMVIHDNAGNVTDTTVSGVGWKTFYYDKTAPTIGSHDSTKYTNNVTGTTRVHLYNVADNLSGVSKVDWYIYKDGTLLGVEQGGVSGTTYYKDVALSGEGTYIIHGIVYDNAGNSYNWYVDHGMTIIADGTAPNHGNWVNSSGTVITGATNYTNAASGSTYRVYAMGASDSFSGVDAMYVWMSTDGGANWNLLSQQRMNETTIGGTRAWYYDVPITVEGSYLIHTCPVDRAGNWTWGGPNQTLVVDRTAPNHGNWVNSSGTVITGATNYTNAASGSTYRVYAMNASDALSGVDAMYVWMSTDGGANWNLLSQQRMNETTIGGTRAWYYDVPITVEGSYLIHTCPVDRAGNWVWGGPNQTLIVDRTAPSAPTITTKYADGTTYTSGSWANKRVNVTLSSTDSASGISKYQYKYGSGSWTDLSDNTDYFEAERNQTIYYRVVDKAGNISNESNFIMRMDTTAPSAPTITTQYADGTTYTGGSWANKRVNVTLSSTDSASGISKYQYKYGSGSWTDLSDNTDYFEAERDQTIYYRAVDKAGNASSATSFKICIDTTAPTSTLITSPTIYTKTSTVTITINATDGFSGMNNVNFMIWSETLGKEESIYSEILTSTDGTYTLNLDLTKKFSETTGKFYVVPYISDKALNTSWGTQTTIYYDITKPTVDSVTFPKYVTSPTFTASATASDIGGSGLYRVGFAAYPAGGDGGKAAWYNDTASPYSVTVDLTETVTGGTEGKYNLHVYAYDNAGNTSTVKAQTLIYDKTAPTVTVADINHGSNASIKLLDSTSGITHWAVTSTTTVPTNTHSSNATTGSTGDLWYPITSTTSETTVTFSGLKVGSYYAWGKDAAGNTKYTQFKVNKATITVPSSPSVKTYNGSSQNSGITAPANTSIVTASSTTSATNAGTYNVVLKLNDTTNYTWSDGTTANKTVTWKINKATVGAPTNVAVSTAGVVTWTAGSNATSHQISIDGTNWTTATSGVDYNSTITAATGSRTVYVRAVNSDTTNYTTPSSNATKAVTVYKLTINKGTGISSVSGAGNYISGRSVSINATASTGYTWSKWTVSSGGSTPASTTTAKTTVTVSAATTLTATATANGLTFSAQTLTAGTYNTAYSKAFTGASNGTGTYTYAVNSVKCGGTAVTASSGKYNGLSLSGTTISGTPTKAGTYVFNVKATDSNSGATASADITIVINKVTVGAPTNVAVSTAGVVTWTAGSNATSHQISIDGTNWTTATSGVDYNSTITAATGSRTVYVRAVNSDTTNYTTPSSNATKAVTVYKLTINKGTGISSVSGAGNYISGRSVSINATASTGYTWS
ncbi:MAG: GBS Bsp-like repeat-containing protein, partial [Clostridia bacterium]|nr:GBS Bsp-like repeat-containing protein [Clostridia bacterium]